VSGALRRLLERVRGHRGISPERIAFIHAYSFPPLLGQKMREAYPQLTDAEVVQVLEGLRQWFLVCLNARGTTVGMPSAAVDEAWHEFILITREYTAFCDAAFGRYLHHTPSASMSEPMASSLARTVRVLDELPTALMPVSAVPLLFALDGELGIPNGHAYDVEHVEWLRNGGWRSSETGDAPVVFSADGSGGGN
jgi:hypothetical protein